MFKKSSTRLVGCIAIESLLAAGLAAADFEYKAGIAEAGQAKALAIEDRSGNRVVIAQMDFTVDRAVADFVAPQVMTAYGLDRAAILLHSARQAAPAPRDAVAAIGAALGDLEPARLLYGAGLAITAPGGMCRAAVSSEGSLAFGDCRGGAAVRGPIRAAFQTVEPAHGLEQRGKPVRLYPIQAITLGKQVAILALGGGAPAATLRRPGLIVVPFSNDSAPMPEDLRIRKAIEALLRRVGNGLRGSQGRSPRGA